jgi:hypothetical protein
MMAGTVTFIQECLTSDREKASNINNSSQQPDSLQERQWAPIITSSGKDNETPLSVAWDHSGTYCAEGSNRGTITIWNFAENTPPYNACDRQGAASFRSLSTSLAKSASLAWSDTCHHIFMASNYPQQTQTQTLMVDEEHLVTSVVSGWCLSGNEIPLHTTR